MKLVKTVKCKLKVDEPQKQAIHDTIAKFTQACNDALAVARKNRLWNAYKLQRLCYRQLKERYGLHANYVVRAVSKVCAKRQRKPKSFKGTSIDLDARLFRFVEATESISLATTKGRLKHLKLSIGNFQRGLLKGQKPTSATLVYKKSGQKRKSFYINFTLEKEVPVPSGGSGGSGGSNGSNGSNGSSSNPCNPIGVDRGIYNLATTSNGLKFSGKEAKHIRKHYFRLRQRLQAKGTKGCKKSLKRLSGKERRWMTNLNHIISRRIVDPCKSETGDIGDILVLENLKHIRRRIKIAKKQKLLQHSWAFGQLQGFIEYKALEKGIPVVYVDPRNTSRRCPKCRHIDKANRNGHRFCCVMCGYKDHADLVAPLNIRQVFIDSLESYESQDAGGWASVNTPLCSPVEPQKAPILGTASS